MIENTLLNKVYSIKMNTLNDLHKTENKKCEN